MNWRRIYPDPDADKQHYKVWQGGRHYRIIWRDEAFGVSITPGFRPLYKSIVNGVTHWELLDRGPRLKRTLKAAKLACESHAKGLGEW